MHTKMFMSFIMAVAHSMAKGSLTIAKEEPVAVLPCPETQLFRAGGAVQGNRAEAIKNLKQLLSFIIGVYNPHASGLSHKAQEWGKSCVARATAMFGNIYGLAASGMRLSAYSKKGNAIGVGVANQKLNIKNRLLWLPVRKILPTETGNFGANMFLAGKFKI